ncbi:MAG: S8 family serine peptidase, partial [Thermoplasmata archaeon]|nr:S8 family serine peptidase [Thermoplasmata archaeon]
MLNKFTAAVILLLMIIPVSTALASSTPPNQAVIDPALRHRLSGSEEHERVEVIIRFHDAIEERDLAYLRVHGFRIFRTFEVMPVVYAEGEKKEIERLSNCERIRWIEFNAPMQYYMNMTKYTIQARDVWLSQIRDGDDVFPPINGSGVTVVVLDSGIDGTHPDLDYNPVDIENGEKPQPGQKVITNVKKDQDIAGEPFRPFEITDTSSGHGTHCAGTVAGNGQASAGRIKGIAPGAWLIGVSMGEGFATIDEYSGMVWVYEHSRPGNNPANIRVVTNSWGPGFPFDSLDPNDATAGVINKLVHENNVAVVFAAGNAGGGHHDGDADTVNIFAKVPAAIGVAAASRDGKSIADFSSRGDKDRVETWPDITAPGVNIWSAAARATLIGAGVGLLDLTRDENDPYYLAISGTSMATPHVAGLVALLYEACPSMTMSEAKEDYECELPLVIEDNSGSFEGGPYYFSDPRIHESELILKLTADYIPAEEGNGVPLINGSTRAGLADRTYDFAQGYGLVNARKAVALALKLQYMRDPDGDGEVEHPEVTVLDAYNKSYEKIIKQGRYSRKTDRISHSWFGEFVDIDRTLATESSVYTNYVPMANQKHSVHIPEDTEELTVEFRYNPLHIRYENITDIPEGSWGYLVFTIDVDEDGEYDYPDQHPIIPDPTRIIDPTKEQEVIVHIDFSSAPFAGARGRNWTFDVLGYAGGIGFIGKGARNEYDMRLIFRLDADEKPKIPYTDFWFEEPSSQYYEGKVYLNQNWYVLKAKDDSDDDFKLSAEVGVAMMLIIALGLTGSWLYLKKKFG